MAIAIGTMREVTRRGIGEDVFLAVYEKTNARWWELKKVRLDLAARDGFKAVEGSWVRSRRERGNNPRREKYGWPKVVTQSDEKLWHKLEITG